MEKSRRLVGGCDGGMSVGTWGGWRSMAGQRGRRVEARKDMKWNRTPTVHPSSPNVYWSNTMNNRRESSRPAGGWLAAAIVFAFCHLRNQVRDSFVTTHMKMRLLWFDTLMIHTWRKKCLGELRALPLLATCLSHCHVMWSYLSVAEPSFPLCLHPPPVRPSLTHQSPPSSPGTGTPVRSDTKGGRRAVTGQGLGALWLGAAECAMVH